MLLQVANKLNLDLDIKGKKVTGLFGKDKRYDVSNLRLSGQVEQVDKLSKILAANKN